MVSLQVRVEQAIKAAGVPITGMSFGTLADRASWKVEPASLQPQAQPVIDAFTPPTAQQIADEEADLETQTKALKAVALALWECIPAPTMTKVQLAARVKAIYKTL